MAGVLHQSSVVETAAGLDTRSAGNEKAPRKNRGAGGSLVARHVRHAYGHEKAPAVLMTVGAGVCGFLDDLHVGADAFRGDVDVSGP